MTTASPAPGEKALTKLLSTLTTILNPSPFVFITLPQTPSGPAVPPPTLTIQMSFQELEGLTIITPLSSAVSHNLPYTFPCRMITLNVHSSLEAVGFIAEVSKKLTEKGIGVNPVSGFFHDHLFVPTGREDEALEVLSDLATEARERVEGAQAEGS
jgi:hypothetical protein